MFHTKFVITYAVISRFVIMVLQEVSNHFIPDHDANAFISPKTTVSTESNCHIVIEKMFGGLRRWDAEYFLHIAKHGYTYEDTLGFYPLFPFCVRFLTQFFQKVVGIGCEFEDLSLLVAVIMNYLFFINSAIIFHELTTTTFNNHRIARIATTLFCFNPASIFFSAAYNDCIFCWCSFNMMLFCKKNQIYMALLFLTLSMWCRSNGIMNLGFIVFFVARDMWKINNRNYKNFTIGFLKIMAGIIVTFLTFVLFQAYYHQFYCGEEHFEMTDEVLDYGITKYLLMPGDQKAEWCSNSAPYSLKYIQNRYWNVGFFNYFEIEQISHFLFGVPILYMIISHAIQFFKNNPSIVIRFGLYNRRGQVENTNQFIYVVHAFALSLFCICFVHIQESTRMLASSSPYIYWICAKYYHKENHSSPTSGFLYPKRPITQFIRAWFLGYFVFGTILFSKFYQWI